MQHLKFNDLCTFNTPAYCVYTSTDTKSHYHTDFYEFSLFTNGSYTDIHNDEKTTYSTGQILLYCPGEAHELVVNKAGSECYSFIVKADFFQDFFKDYCERHRIPADISHIPPTLSRQLAGFQTLYLSQLASAISYNISPERFSIVAHFLESLLFVCFDVLPMGSSVGNEFLVNDLLRRFDNYQDLDTDISSLCHMYPTSQRTLLNRFKALTGYTIVEYRNIKRMEYAAHLLQKEDYQIATIANMVNISCLSYFSKQFKKQFGMTPKQYQKIHRKK